MYNCILFLKYLHNLNPQPHAVSKPFEEDMKAVEDDFEKLRTLCLQEEQCDLQEEQCDLQS